MTSPNIRHLPEDMHTRGPDGSTPAPNHLAHKKRLGLFPVRAGATIEHVLLTIDLPLEPAVDSTIVRPEARGRRRGMKPGGPGDRFVMGSNPLDMPIGGKLPDNHPLVNGSPMPVALRVGSKVTCDVIDGTRDEFLEGPAAEHAKFACLHPSCRGKRWDSPDELRRAHPTTQDMRDNFEAHPYYGVCEVPAVLAHPGSRGKKDEKSGAWIERPVEAREASDAYLLLFSTEVREDA